MRPAHACQAAFLDRCTQMVHPASSRASERVAQCHNRGLTNPVVLGHILQKVSKPDLLHRLCACPKRPLLPIATQEFRGAAWRLLTSKRKVKLHYQRRKGID